MGAFHKETIADEMSALESSELLTAVFAGSLLYQYPPPLVVK